MQIHVTQEQINTYKAGGMNAIEAAIAEKFPQARIDVSRLGGNQIFIKFDPFQSHIITHAFPLVGKASHFENAMAGGEGRWEDEKQPFSFNLNVEKRRDDFGQPIS